MENVKSETYIRVDKTDKKYYNDTNNVSFI